MLEPCLGSLIVRCSAEGRHGSEESSWPVEGEVEGEGENEGVGEGEG